MTFDVRFIDGGREPECKPDPRWPEGKPVNLAPPPLSKLGGGKTCTRNLPYPAPRCGLYQIICRKCGYTAAITVAGRSDDPNMVTLPCKQKGLNA